MELVSLCGAVRRNVFAGAQWGRWLHFGELWSQLVRELGVVVAAATSALVMARIERPPWSAYGLPVRRIFLRRFWIDAVWGFAGISLLVIALYEANAFDFGHIVLHNIVIIRFGLFWGEVFSWSDCSRNSSCAAMPNSH